MSSPKKILYGEMKDIVRAELVRVDDTENIIGV